MSEVMTASDTVARAVAFLPWNSPDGIPERIVPSGVASSRHDSEVYIQRRADVKVRALPDGTPQVLAPTAYGARVVRLSPSPAHVDIKTTGQVKDAVLTEDGHATALVWADGGYMVHRLRPDGTTAWPVSVVADAGGHRLITDARGRVFLTANGLLSRVDVRTATPLADQRLGPRVVIDPCGWAGFATLSARGRVLNWVLRDLDSTAEIVIGARKDNHLLLASVIGVDAAGRVYGGDGRWCRRMSPTGAPDWAVELGGVAVSRQHGIAMLFITEDFGGVLVTGDGQIVAKFSHGNSGYLTGRTDDGGYVLHDGGVIDGRLLYLDTRGRQTRSEPAGGDKWLKNDVHGKPEASSVTPDGEVLIPVRTRDGVHIVALAPKDHRKAGLEREGASGQCTTGDMSWSTGSPDSRSTCAAPASEAGFCNASW
ncbi:hypothetical protein [Plantactinospora mayteni]|uniref:hypothetical protein n=1 Tax=Plantactinospora mayteni TaxID=566021 RepID=UPI0019410D47|nr:hypothetical protein [Plantactinospora mayteni]